MLRAGPNAAKRNIQVAQARCIISVMESRVKQFRGLRPYWTPVIPIPLNLAMCRLSREAWLETCACVLTLAWRIVKCSRAAHSVLVLLQEGHLVLGLPARVQEMPLIVVPYSCCCLHTGTHDELPPKSFTASSSAWPPPASMPATVAPIAICPNQACRVPLLYFASSQRHKRMQL